MLGKILAMWDSDRPYSPVRIVGFDVEASKIESSTSRPSPITVVRTGVDGSPRVESPPSSLAAALRVEARPLPSLSIRTPRGNFHGYGAPLKKSSSHQNLSDKQRDLDPSSPGSRSSSSTPIHIPCSSLGRVQTCPVDLSTLQATAAVAAAVGLKHVPNTCQPRHSRRASLASVTSMDSDLSAARDLAEGNGCLFQERALLGAGTQPGVSSRTMQRDEEWKR